MACAFYACALPLKDPAPSPVSISIRTLTRRKAALLKTRVPETTKACKQALFYLPALISSIYISVTVALHKVDLTYPTSMIGTR